MRVRKLAGKVAVVTGASSGVGRAIARAFAAEGAKVGLIARSVEALENTAQEVRELGGEALVLPIDVSEAPAVEEAAEHVVAEWGRVDIWVNNAMVSVFAPVRQMEAAEFRRVTEVNYLGYVYGTLAALRHMRRQDAGTIVQIGSALAYRSIPLQSAYCASKAAIRGFTDSLRSELIREKSPIALSMLQLPAVNTPQFEVVRNKLGGHPQPVPPIYQPEVIGRAAVRAALRPKREMWVAWSSAKAILGQRVLPGFLDRYLAKEAWDGQTTRQLPEGHPRRHHTDNVDSPVPGDRGAHGPFDEQARTKSSYLWAGMHARLLTLGGIVGGVVLTLLTAWIWKRAR